VTHGGGELQLWDEVVVTEQDCAARRQRDWRVGSRTYGLSRADLDEPDWTVRPGAGDLFVALPGCTAYGHW